MGFIKGFKESLKKASDKRKLIKQEKFYRSMLKRNEVTGIEGLFSGKGITFVIITVTLFLQIVSLSTTFNGSKVYFGGIKLPFGISAPFLFAISIQGIVFYVSNSLRTNFRKWLVIVLTISTITSIYFSYIGIYNYINSPVNYLNEKYSQIHGDLKEKYISLKENLKSTTKEELFTLSNDINNKYLEVTKEVEKNKELKQKIDAIKINSNLINAQTNALKRPNIADYGNDLNKYYEDMAKYNAAVGTMVSSSSSQSSTLKNELYQNEVKGILGGKPFEEFTKESIKAEASKELIEKSMDSLYKLVNTNADDKASLNEKLQDIENYCEKYITNGVGSSDSFSTVMSSLNSLGLQLEIKNPNKDMKSKLSKFIAINNNNNTIVMKDLKQLTEEVYKDIYHKEVNADKIRLTEKDAMVLYSYMETEIRNMTYLINQISDSKLIDKNDPKYSIYNLYVLPMKNLFEAGSAREMAWFCLVFAMLVDVLSIIFALTNGKKNTILFAKKNRDIVGRSEEHMEEILLLAIIADGKEYIGQELITKTRERLVEFLSEFTLIQDEIINGYSMSAPVEKFSDYQIFISTLCQFNLAAIVKPGELIMNKETSEMNTKDYILIKTKFILWANEKITMLSANNAYIEGLLGEVNI